jgi:N-acetylglucosaminyldiphosphoundecaprenol N-acetyl-beta-D-mannosaminyltransferase
MPIDRRRPHFLDIDFDCASLDEAATIVERLSKAATFTYIVTPNVDHILMLHPTAMTPTNGTFQTAYASAQLRFCDSRIVQKLAEWKGIPLDVVAGSDLTEQLFKQGHVDSSKMAIVGGDPDFLDALQARYPQTTFVQHCPPMGVLRDTKAREDIVHFVRQSGAHYTLFAIGAPQSEIIAHQCKADGRCTGVGLCIGASVEFILGRKKRAPKWLQRMRMEWAFRLASEPRRLWKRYLVIGPRIFLLAARWRPS